MNVFAYYCEGAPLSLWVRSWKSRGWKPKILMKGAKRVRPTVGCWVINYSLRPRRQVRPKKFGEKGWGNAPVVAYPEHFDEVQILNYRPL